MRFIFAPLTGMLALIAAIGMAIAQDRYPSKPINIVVPFPPGVAALDVLARLYADRVAKRLGQPVIVQNRPGSAGTLATNSVAKSSPDGYTILFTNALHSTNPALYNNLPYDTLREFAGVSLVAEAPVAVLVGPQMGARTLKEFIALAKERPGTIHYGGGAAGTPTHLSGAYFAHQAGITLVHVPYKEGNILGDLMSNRIQAMFVPVAPMIGHLREGKLLALGITSREAMREPVEIPSVRESGLSGFEYHNWYGLLVPAKTPAAVLEQLSREIRQITEEKEIKDKLIAQGFIIHTLSLGEFDTYIRTDMERMGAFIKAIGVKAD